jgi:multiple sugar transport system permease protein
MSSQRGAGALTGRSRAPAGPPGPPGPPGPSHFHRRRREDALTGYAFIAPYLVTAAVFTFALLAYAFYLSLTDFKAAYQQAAPSFVGLANYARAFRDHSFLQSLQNVFWYALIVTGLQTALSVTVASLLNARLPGIGLFRTLIYSPSVASSIVVSLIFIWLFLRTGIVNYVLHTNVDWLLDPTPILDGLYRALRVDPTVVPGLLRGPSVTWTAIMALNVFTTVPIFMLMFLAGLQNIPAVVYEAGALDGATGVRAFRYLTVQLLRPTFVLVLVLGTIGTFQVFDQVAIITQGGPLGTTQVPAYYIYQKTLGTETQPEAGYAAAMAFVLATIIVASSALQRRYLDVGSD